MRFFRPFLFVGAIGCPIVVVPSQGIADTELPEDLTKVELRDLLNFELVVTSPGKKEQPLSSAASAIFVLTSEDIRRSGATHIAEALRMVPGVDVARISSNRWAVSVRGFNQDFANKLLVLVDGISIFSPYTNGVYWETIDLPLQDVDRVEVIRGPGASLWGSNAVNGVINIITKHSSQTKGTYVSAGGGTHERAFVSAREGVQIDEDTSARLSVKGSDRKENAYRAGGAANDDWSVGSLDSRIDYSLGEGSQLTFLNHAFSADTTIEPSPPSLSPPYVDPISYSGTGFWSGTRNGVKFQKDFTDGSSLNVLTSYWYQALDSKLTTFSYSVYEFDTDYRFTPAEDHDVVVGLAGRLFKNSSVGTFPQELVPSDRSLERLNYFVQDEWTLCPEKLALILGSKFEHNDSTGFEYMPNARLVWTPNKQNTLWASVTKAVAPPSLVFEDVRFPASVLPGPTGAPVGLIEVQGNRGVESENLLAYEIGYRGELSEDLFVDIAAFYNDYRDLLSNEPGIPGVTSRAGRPDPMFVVPLSFQNQLAAETIGGEVALEYKPFRWWRMTTSFSYAHSTAFEGGSLDSVNPQLIEASAPQYKATYRSLMDLTEWVSFDLLGRYVSAVGYGTIPDYGEVDARLGFRVTEGVDVSIIGQNLLNSAHPEFIGSIYGPPPTVLERGVFGRLTVSF